MILDKEALFSDDQAVTADAASTNVIDLGVARDIGKGMPVPLLIQVTEDFDNLTSLKVLVQVDDNEGFSSATVAAETGAILLADLKEGYQFPLAYVPNGVDERYVRLNYDVTGTAPTSGKVTAGLTLGNQASF